MNEYIANAFNKERNVSFVIAGVNKGGTTALDAYLRKHPQVCMAKEKEVHFFDTESYFTEGKPDYSIYHSFFNAQPSHRLLGEATPSYMYWREAPRRIWEYNPGMKIVAILRNPIDRAYSQWNMQRDRGTDTLAFWDALHIEHERCRESLPLQNLPYSYVSRGFYSEQLRRLWLYFPPAHTLILKTEDLREEPRKTLDQFCDFLGVDMFQRIEPHIVHSRPYTSPMTEREKEYLRHVYEYEIKQLERLLNWDCTDWLAD